MFGSPWQAPLVVVLLLFLAGGVVLGIMSMLGVVYRQRREISRLQKALTVDGQNAAKSTAAPLVP